MAESPVRLLVKLPVPVPAFVVEFAIVGEEDVLQQIPFAVMADPPSLLMLPPDIADVAVMLDIELVVTVGRVNSPKTQRTEFP